MLQLFAGRYLSLTLLSAQFLVSAGIMILQIKPLGYSSVRPVTSQQSQHLCNPLVNLAGL